MPPPLSRRSVLRGTAVAAAAGVVGYAAANASDAAGAKADTTAANGYGATDQGGTRIAAVGDVPDGGAIILAGPGLVLTRDASGQLRAFSSTCTHQGCKVDSVQNGLIVCPCHNSRFDATTGAPVSGPARRPLPEIAVEVRGEDIYTG